MNTFDRVDKISKKIYNLFVVRAGYKNSEIFTFLFSYLTQKDTQQYILNQDFDSELPEIDIDNTSSYYDYFSQYHEFEISLDSLSLEKMCKVEAVFIQSVVNTILTSELEHDYFNEKEMSNMLAIFYIQYYKDLIK